MDKISYIVDMIPAITVYHSLKKDPVVNHMYQLCVKLGQKSSSFSDIMNHYSVICQTLYAGDFRPSLPDYLFDKVLSNENVFSRMCSKNDYVRIPLAIKKAVEYDLNTLYMLSTITSEELRNLLMEVFPEKQDCISLLPSYTNDHKQFSVKTSVWGKDIISIGEFHRRNGVGIFTKYYAFYIGSEQQIVPVKYFDPITLSSLKKYDEQKKIVVDNTLAFLNKKPASNILLYGDRGTGKSTTVKAILSEFYSRGLRMLQIGKQQLSSLPQMLQLIENIPLRFILFIDDLTFNEHEHSFNTLKAMLEGSLFEMPSNVIIYATSNRIHMVKETFSARQGEDLHASDTRDETVSLADRFGITVTFLQPTLEDFLEIVVELAEQRQLKVEAEQLRRGAVTFAVRKGSRSGRVARQYVDGIESKLSLATETISDQGE